MLRISVIRTNVLLAERLRVLDTKTKEIAQNLATNNAQAPVVNGQFLRDKFSTQPFLRV